MAKRKKLRIEEPMPEIDTPAPEPEPEPLPVPLGVPEPDPGPEPESTPDFIMDTTPEEHNVVLCGFNRAGKEFSVTYHVNHQRTRAIAIAGRVFEYTGDDAAGRRVYRSHDKW